jgi:hypothetical protein
MGRLACVLLCLIASPAWAQITVPAQVEAHAPIVARAELGDSATGSVQVLWEAGPGVYLLPIGDGSTVHAWAPPGEHALRCDVFRVNWDAKTFDIKRHAARFRVGPAPEPVPPPDPTPPPTPPTPDPPAPVGKLTAVIVHETEDDSPAVARMFIGLRSGASAKWLADQGHKLLILDDDTVDATGQPVQLVATLKALGVPMPALFVLDGQDRVLLKQTLAEGTTADNVIELLRRAGG